jgi:hypothetical protein
VVKPIFAASHFAAEEPEKPITGKCQQCNEEMDLRKYYMIIAQEKAVNGGTYCDKLTFHMSCFQEIAGNKFIKIIAERAEEEERAAPPHPDPYTIRTVVKKRPAPYWGASPYWDQELSTIMWGVPTIIVLLIVLFFI